MLSAAIAPFVFAAETPPLKPGLWQITAEYTVAGQPAPSAAERMRSMRPQGGSGPIRSCMTRASMQRGQFQSQPENGHCNTTFSSQAASGWKWHTVCSLPRANGTVIADGEVMFLSPENYQLKTTSTMQVMGRTTRSSSRMTAKWIATDCGEVKPRLPRGKNAVTPGALLK